MRIDLIDDPRFPSSKESFGFGCDRIRVGFAQRSGSPEAFGRKCPEERKEGEKDGRHAVLVKKGRGWGGRWAGWREKPYF
jgi:hypothetical protein